MGVRPLGTLWIPCASKVGVKWKCCVASPHRAACWPEVSPPPGGKPSPYLRSPLLGRDSSLEDIDDAECCQGKQLPAKQDEDSRQGAGCSGIWKDTRMNVASGSHHATPGQAQPHPRLRYQDYTLDREGIPAPL